MTSLKTPEALVDEHHEIFRELRSLAEKEGETGREVRKLLAVLEPHFEREEETAMPLLGVLGPLSEGKTLGDPAEVMSLHERFSSEYPSMLKEHEQVREYINRVRKTASKMGERRALVLMDQLKHHAAVEEEVLYPAAMLVGALAKADTKVRVL